MYYVAVFLSHLPYADKRMQLTVEILLIVGILVNLIKGADLILRPHQQKLVQDRIETLALWLDYKSVLI